MEENFFILDGEFRKPQGISVEHRGFLLGDGLFETMRVYEGKVLFVERHYQRLLRSAEFLQMQVPLSLQDLKKQAYQLIEQSTILQGVLRFTIARVQQERSLLPKDAKSTYLLSLKPLNPLKEHLQRPLNLAMAPFSLNEDSPLCSMKSTNYLEKIIALQQRLEFDDVIFLNRAKKLVSTSKANLFLVKEQKVFTPTLEDGALAGISRSLIIERALKAGIELYSKALVKEDLFAADEVFLSNALIGMAFVEKIENKILKKGPFFSRLSNELFKAWKEYGNFEA